MSDLSDQTLPCLPLVMIMHVINKFSSPLAQVSGNVIKLKDLKMFNSVCGGLGRSLPYLSGQQSKCVYVFKYV